MKISRLLFLSLLTLWTRVVFADANTTISAAEYFVDTDPGEGSGTALSAQDGAFDSEVEAIAPVDLQCHRTRSRSPSDRNPLQG